MSKEYDYECMRADLLGRPKPDINSFPPEEPKVDEDETADMENDLNLIADEEASTQQKDQAGRPGLDQVQDILAITQKKLTTLKMGIGNVGSGFSTSLGSFTTYVKQRIGGEASSATEAQEGSAPVHSAPVHSAEAP